jgi:integrase
VEIPTSQSLAAELASIERVGARVVTCEVTKRPYSSAYFHRVWRAATLKTGLDELTFLALRRSAVVRLAEAGCESGQIAAWTGHSIGHAQGILDTYFVPTRAAAAAVLVKLERHRQEESRP